jgi:hypothetical protein
MKKLNRDKDFYQVMGHAGAAFEQDGCLFDDAGNEVVELVDEQPEAGDDTATGEELGRLRDLLSQKEATLTETSNDLEKALDRAAAAELKAGELEKRVNDAEQKHEEELSRADGLQAKVTGLESKIVELEAKLAATADAPPAGNEQLPLDGGKPAPGGKK